MTFAPGDHVHIATLGTGIVREVRNGGRCLVEIKGRSVVVFATQLTRAASVQTRHAKPSAANRSDSGESTTAGASLDLHGKTVDEALEILDAFLNDAFLAGNAEVRIIHGRSGGKIKAAVHARLKRVSAIRSFGLDPRNPGVTIVRL